MSIGEIFADPQYAARENLIQVDDPRIGSVTIPAPLPRMTKTPPQVKNTGPELGSANAYVFGALLVYRMKPLQNWSQEGPSD